MELLQGSVNVCVLVNLESAVCVLLVNFYLYQPERRKGIQLSVSMLYVSPVYMLKADLVWGILCDRLTVFCLCLCLCVSRVCATGWTCKRGSSSCIPQPGQRPQVSGCQTGPQWPCRSSAVTEQLEEVAKLYCT